MEAYIDALRDSNLGADAVKVQAEFETYESFSRFFREECERSHDKFINSLVHRVGLTRVAADLLFDISEFEF